MRFVWYEDKAGEFRWRLVAANNRIVAESGEGYVDRHGVLRAIHMIKSFGRMLGGAQIQERNRVKPREISDGQAVVAAALEDLGNLTERAKVSQARARKRA